MAIEGNTNKYEAIKTSIADYLFRAKVFVPKRNETSVPGTDVSNH